MPRFTKFGIFDAEVRAFLNDLCDALPLDMANKINNWFYDEAIIIFLKKQFELHSAFINKSLAKTELYPLISELHARALNDEGFIKVLVEFNFFLQDLGINLEGSSDIQDKFNLFAKDAVDKHRSFYSLQVEVTNEYHDKLNNDANFKSDKSKHFAFIKDRYNHYKKVFSNLNVEIQNYITVLEELSAYRKEKKAQLNNREESRPEIKNENENEKTIDRLKSFLERPSSLLSSLSNFVRWPSNSTNNDDNNSTVDAEAVEEAPVYQNNFSK